MSEIGSVIHLNGRPMRVVEQGVTESPIRNSEGKEIGTKPVHWIAVEKLEPGGE